MKNQTKKTQNKQSYDYILEEDVIEANKKVYNESAKTYDEIVITKD